MGRERLKWKSAKGVKLCKIATKESEEVDAKSKVADDHRKKQIKTKSALIFIYF